MAAQRNSVVTGGKRLAQRIFPNQDAVHRHIYWTDPVMNRPPSSCTKNRVTALHCRSNKCTAPHQLASLCRYLTTTCRSPCPSLKSSLSTILLKRVPVFRRPPLHSHTPAQTFIHCHAGDADHSGYVRSRPTVERAATLEYLRAEVSQSTPEIASHTP